MRTLRAHLGSHAEGDLPLTPTLTLAFAQRQKSRLRVRLDSGEEVAVILPRGRVLRGGDRLVADDGALVRVQAQVELVSSVRCEDARSLARAAYHLGNRHVPVEVGDGLLRYLHDHVLDDMVRALGLAVHSEHAPFEPEGGAYREASGHAHSHASTDAGHEPVGHEQADVHAAHGHADHGAGHPHSHGIHPGHGR